MGIALSTDLTNSRLPAVFISHPFHLANLSLVLSKTR
jgi:hypothetical protein